MLYAVIIPLAVLLAPVLLLMLLPPVYKMHKTAGGQRRNSSLYITMRDGVRIAVDVWLPLSLKEGERIPTVLRSTRYVRAIEPGLYSRLLLRFSQKNALMGEMLPWEASGFAGVLMDVRGTGASFGSQRVSWAPDEIEDIREVIDWITQQPWSDGQVGAYGISYHGNTAEYTAALGHPAVRAVAPLFSDYDPYMLACPGGVLSEGFLRLWQDSNRALDDGDIAKAKGVSGFSTILFKLMYRGIQPVDGRGGRRLLKQAIKEHAHNADVLTECGEIQCRDDKMPCGLSMQDTSSLHYKAEIESGNIPMFVAVGLLDAATVDGAVERFNSFCNPQELYIGPWTHSGKAYVDTLFDGQPQGVGLFRPFLLERIIEFFTYHFGKGGSKPPDKLVRYYTMGEGVMREAAMFPPAEVNEKSFHFQQEGALAESRVSHPFTLEHMMDFTVSTGRRNRWFTQLSGGNIDFGDRSEQDDKLLTFTSVPLDEDVRIMGKPVVNLTLSVDAAESAFFVYLEAVDDSGCSRYITEGILCSGVDGESFIRADMRMHEPGEVREVAVRLFTVSALISKGWRLRVAIGGHDSSLFRRYPKEGDVSIVLHGGGAFNSSLVLPVLPMSMTNAEQIDTIG